GADGRDPGAVEAAAAVEDQAAAGQATEVEVGVGAVVGLQDGGGDRGRVGEVVGLRAVAAQLLVRVVGIVDERAAAGGRDRADQLLGRGEEVLAHVFAVGEAEDQ